MSSFGGDSTFATVLRYTDHAICGTLCSPSARSSSMTVGMYLQTVMLLLRAEGLPVRGGGPLARLQVPARDAERAVALRTEGRLALAVRGRQRGRIHLVL